MLILNDFYYEIVLSFFVFVFPILFELIFGTFPLEALRKLRSQPVTPVTPHLQRRSKQPKATLHPLPDAAEQSAKLSTQTSADTITVFSKHASESRAIAERIFVRAGVYLLVGVLVAFSGLAFFYALSRSDIWTGSEAITKVLFTLAPRFGVLFFIELIAFFFLRQYRSAMDEFRYYEALKRQREEALGLLYLVKEAGKPLDPLELVKNGALFSKAGIMEKGQSSELLEARKLEKNELEILDKVIDTVARSKR